MLSFSHCHQVEKSVCFYVDFIANITPLGGFFTNYLLYISHTGRQAGKERDRQVNRQADRQTDRQTDREAGMQVDRQTGRQAGRQKVRQTDTQTRVPIKLGLVDGND